jgi:stearoyl-CoA desaturase (delta-9 desaturase)
VPDLGRYPELRWLDRYDIAVPVALAAALAGLRRLARPEHGTSGAQMLVWGFFVSTVLLFHVTVTINSLGAPLRPPSLRHRRRQPQQLAAGAAHLRRGLAQQPPPLPGAVRQGVAWWELDLTWYLLARDGALGLVWD